MRPGTNVTTSTALPPVLPATKTGTWFAVGPTAFGPTSAPVLCTSMAQFIKIFGPRFTTVANSATFFDAVETFFAEGGSRLYVQRWAGAGIKATAVIKNGAEASLEATAAGPGTGPNSWKVVITLATGEAFSIQIQNGAGEVLESSPVFNTRAEAVNYFKNSVFVTFKEGAGTKNPAAGTTSLATGTDVAPTISKAEAEAQLEKFAPELGPGQLSVPGITTTPVIEALFIQAAKQLRIAVADAPLNETKANHVTLANAIRGLASNAARSGAIYSDWQQVAPAAGTFGVRAVPCSAFVAANLSVNDNLTSNPNQPCAGKWGILPQSLGREAPTFSEKEIEELAEAGINVTKTVNGQVRIYGFRTPVNALVEPLYAQVSNSRLDMAIDWKGKAILEEYFGSEIDGQGKDASNLATDLEAMMLKLYSIGAIFGEKPGEAFTVETGKSINPATSEAEGNLNAQIAYRRSPGAEYVLLNLTRVSITQGV